MNKLLKKINKTDDVARKVDFGRHMSEHTGENNNLVNEMTLSRMKLLKFDQNTTSIVLN